MPKLDRGGLSYNLKTLINAKFKPEVRCSNHRPLSMTLNIKLGLLGVWKEVCTVFHSILAQIPLIFYRKKKKWLNC